MGQGQGIDWREIVRKMGFESLPVMLREIYRETGTLERSASKVGVSPTSYQKKMVELGIPRVPRYVDGPA